jgi:uncharacterized membrane protein
MDRFLLHAKSAFPTSLWVMQEVEQCRSNCREHGVSNTLNQHGYFLCVLRVLCGELSFLLDLDNTFTVSGDWEPAQISVRSFPLRRTNNKNNTKREKLMNNITTTASEESAKTLTTVIYALYAASYFVGVTAIVAIVMNYVKRDDVVGTFLESHFRWQIRTFWFGMLWGVLGAITMMFIIGWFVLIANGIWIIYRIVKGWLRLNDGKPMYTA